MESSIELNVAQVSNRGNKFAVVAGLSILEKFKTEEKVIEAYTSIGLVQLRLLLLTPKKL